MAKIDASDPSVFLTQAAYSNVKEKKDVKNTRTGKSEKTGFSDFFNTLLTKTADEIGPVNKMPVSDESVNRLMDDVRDAGDRLIHHPLPEEILRYKQAVRNFINYIVQNTYSLDYEEGIQNKFKPSYKGRRTAPGADKSKAYTKISIIDKKLEDLAAMLLTSQGKQLELVSRLEEIKGLLIDLMQ